MTLPDGTVMVPSLQRGQLPVRAAGADRGFQDRFVEFLKGQEYDAKGQRQFAHYGNDVLIRYLYDPDTFRLTDLLTVHVGEDPAHARAAAPALHLRPGRQRHRRSATTPSRRTSSTTRSCKPECRYEYDAIYQLIRATGRELAGLTNDTIRDRTPTSTPSAAAASSTTPTRCATYTEEYDYDLLGNIIVLQAPLRRSAGAAAAGRAATATRTTTTPATAPTG